MRQYDSRFDRRAICGGSAEHGICSCNAGIARGRGANSQGHRRTGSSAGLRQASHRDHTRQCGSTRASMWTACDAFSMRWTADDPGSDWVQVWLATGHPDMRCGFPGLALRVQEVLKRDPLGGVNGGAISGRRGGVKVGQLRCWRFEAKSPLREGGFLLFGGLCRMSR